LPLEPPSPSCSQHGSQSCAARPPVLCCWAAAEFGLVACAKFFYFSEYIKILASSKFCIDLNSSQKILKQTSLCRS
jgi:hypothetical protein